MFSLGPNFHPHSLRGVSLVPPFSEPKVQTQAGYKHQAYSFYGVLFFFPSMVDSCYLLLNTFLEWHYLLSEANSNLSE